MLIFGIDVVVMSIVALVSVCFTYIICKTMGMTREDGIVAVTTSFITGAVMLISYIVMAAILDAMLGATW